MSCPHEFSNQAGLCEELHGAPPGAHVPYVRPFSEVINEAANHTGRVLMTVATFDYAAGALSWHDGLVHGYSGNKPVQGGVVVISMDLGAYVYLTNRGIPTVLIPTAYPLYPCCLRKYMMIPWRSTNNIKARIILSGCLVVWLWSFCLV